MSEHHGHPIHQPRSGATAAEWCREPIRAPPEHIETHLNLWLRRESLTSELEHLRSEYRLSAPAYRAAITERAAMAQASIGNLNERINSIRPSEKQAA